MPVVGPHDRGTVNRETFVLLPGEFNPPVEHRALTSPREFDPTVLVRLAPEYPARALRNGIEGYAVVRFWIGPTGDVVRAEIAQAHPRGVFDSAALAAARRWRYQPGMTEGHAVARGPFEVLLNFNLSDARR
jgi:protein TonB